jgi:hypothetical protein
MNDFAGVTLGPSQPGVRCHRAAWNIGAIQARTNLSELCNTSVLATKGVRK